MDKRKVTLLHPEAKIPIKKYVHDAGHDCVLIEDLVIPPHSSIKFPLGFAIQIKPGQMLTIRSRSSTKMKGVCCAQTTCDAGYTGQLHGFMINPTSTPVSFFKGQRVVQLVFLNLAPSLQIIQGQLDPTERSTLGFGSSGKF